MGKHGPCRHCGVTSTPLWRNGPPEKPVLCNACGSRWRTKGSLANYTPLHAREPIEWEEPKVAKMKSISSKIEEQKLLKRKHMHGIVKNEREMLLSEPGQNYFRTFDVDSSNRSSSGSAISYSESCANFGAADTSDWTGSAQSNAKDSLVRVPSKKRSVIQVKASPVEKLTKDLYSIWHEQQSSNLSGFSEHDLLFESKTNMDSVEIGHGGVLLRYPSSKDIEEESEASSLPVSNKLISDAYSRSASFLVNTENKSTSFSGIDKTKNSTLHVTQEHAKRVQFSLENLSMLQDRESPLRFIDLKDVVSLEVFMEHMTNEEQQRLVKYLHLTDTATPPESLRSLFSSPQFMENLTYFQQLLQDGIFDLSVSQTNVEDRRTLKSLVLHNFTKSRWVERYKQLKDVKLKQVTGQNSGEDGTNFLQDSNLMPIKSPQETQNLQLQDSEGTMRSPKRVCKFSSTKFPPTKASVLNPREISSKEMLYDEEFVEIDGTCFSPRSLFASPADRSSMLKFTDDCSDQVLLLDLCYSASLPEAELLYHPWNQKTAFSNSSLAERCAVAEEESLCN